MRRSRALLLVACFSLLRPDLACAANDVAYKVVVDGRRVDRPAGSIIERRGTMLVDAVTAVRLFDGLLGFSNGGKIVRVTIAERTMNFVVGQKTAYLDGMRIVLPAAPLRIDGDVYVPLSTVAKLGSARVAVDRARHIASFRSGGGSSFAPSAAASPSQSERDDFQPSPTEALAIVTSATVDAKGLHAVANVRNTTIDPYELSFPSQKQIAFVLLRNGEEVWNSASDARGESPSSIVIGPLASKTFLATDPDFEALGAGRYQLRLRLETLIPLDLPPVSIGDAPAAPSSR